MKKMLGKDRREERRSWETMVRVEGKSAELRARMGWDAIAVRVLGQPDFPSFCM
jgi:hypothetical protein